MKLEEIVKQLSLSDHPVGLGGCKSHKTTFDCCEYNITVFDGKKLQEQVRMLDDKIIKIHHGGLDESNPDILQKYETMSIISDNDWSLGIFLSKIKEKNDKIRQSCVKSCLVDAVSFATKAKQGLKSDPFAPAWIKCAAYFISDALVLLNSRQRSPTHMLEFIRKFEKNKINESFSSVAETIGLERATPSLLERMVKSTIGFSDIVENNNHSKIIARKYQYLVENSLLSDCYFYLGYVNKINIVSIKDSIHKKPELIHILKVACDFENDPTRIDQQAKLLHKMANGLMQSLQNYA
jgi:hypothetical protein